jgi:uncharacterized protein GlcG (DUF336 family)
MSKRMTLKGLKVLDSCVKKCAAKNLKMNIAVVDNGGNLVSFLRMDDAWLGSIDIAIKKAKTAVMFNMDTDIIGTLSQPGKSLYGIEHSNDGLITFAGGVPIYDENDVLIGGIGVSGDSVENDKMIALVGKESLNGVSDNDTK